MLQMDFTMITFPEDLESTLTNIERLKAGEIKEFTMEKRCIRKDGSTCWVNLTVSPMWETGAPYDYHVAVVEDITARKYAEAELRASEARFRVLFEQAGVGVAVIETASNRFIRINRKYAAILVILWRKCCRWISR